jgi:MinD superfamily P-loop ATPase
MMVLRITGDCLNCGICLDNCKIIAITEQDEKYFIDPDECTECGICYRICPVQAIAEEE